MHRDDVSHPSAPVWRPAGHPWTRGSHVAGFMARHGIAAVAELRERSVADTAWFWEAALEEMGVEWSRRFDRVRDDSEGFPWTRWFPGGRLNVTHNCIDRHVRDGHGGETALLYESDSGLETERRRVTFGELSCMVDRCASALAGIGVQRGDSVALYAPMQVATAVVLFATMKIGARSVPIFCGYGEEALRERLESCGATVLFAASRLERRGRRSDTRAIARAAAGGVPSLRRTVWTDTRDWEEFLSLGHPGVPCEDTEAEDPCLVLFTSGTTGRAKGTVHTHAGCLAQMGKELRYSFDARPGEPFFWVTDIGWMMGPWELIGCLLYRTPVVLLDGAANHPTGDRIWEICSRLGVVTLGVSPTLIRLLMRSTDGKGPEGYDLSRLRVLGSTGEVWDETSYLWYFGKVGGGRCPVMNISGGTEIVGCHLLPTPLDSLRPCSLGGAGLGMDVAVFDDEGRVAPPGSVGHLVCRQPAPSMTKGFLGDRERYLETYFSRFPGVWCHGDWARRDDDGQWFLLGRTDDTFKVAGKRVGPGEVEGALAAHPSVNEAVVIGVPDEIKGTALVGFVLLRPGASATEDELIGTVARRLGKPLAPREVHAVSGLPKTRSGKIVRGAITRAFLGQPAGDVSSIDNPEALGAIGALSGAAQARAQ
jgi:acetyl-CoA synthetase